MNGQYPLSIYPPSDIRLVKRYQIYVSSKGGYPATDLKFHILGYEDVDRFGNGKEVTAADDFTKIVRDFVVAPPKIDPGLANLTTPAPTPLDFVVRKPCCVILKLIGDFWEYTPNSLYVSTKHEYPDGKYRRAFPLLDDDGRITAVGFFVEYVTNPQHRKTCDGLNLYVDFLQGDLRMPTIIDPEVENKGNHDSLPPPEPKDTDDQG
ncbi:nucleotide synthetase [Sphingomonas azotifigens]|uniref:nucleotide synthetase n=1 Tax=Sphingomonas azotifigens TaxID=330920 RepID=UPI00111C2F15|nr:nucleotide synthetase [Sphingomonas azotifigens]